MPIAKIQGRGQPHNEGRESQLLWRYVMDPGRSTTDLCIVVWDIMAVVYNPSPLKKFLESLVRDTMHTLVSKLHPPPTLHAKEGSPLLLVCCDRIRYSPDDQQNGYDSN